MMPILERNSSQFSAHLSEERVLSSSIPPMSLSIHRCSYISMNTLRIATGERSGIAVSSNINGENSGFPRIWRTHFQYRNGLMWKCQLSLNWTLDWSYINDVLPIHNALT